MNLYKKKIIKMLVLPGLLTGLIFFPGDTAPTDGKVMGFNADDLVVRTPDGLLLLFPFENGTFVGPRAGKRVGHNWHGFECINYLVGNWTGNGIRDIIVRKKDGHLYLFPMKKETFYIRGSGRKVKENFSFNYTHYFVGNWTGNGPPGIIVRKTNGDLLLYPFFNQTFNVRGAGRKVGEGFNYEHYFVGQWTDDLGPAIPVFDFNDWAQNSTNFPAAHTRESQ